MQSLTLIQEALAMPSPFPGMDPYLEGELWTNFHTQFAVEIARQLSPLLRPRYAAFTEKRFVVDSPEDGGVFVASMKPDVGVATLGSKGPHVQSASFAAPLETVSLLPEEVPHVWIEIRDVEHRKLVTCIEFLSSTNKRGEGRDEYLKRRTTLLRSEVNLVELDLTRNGQRVPLRDALPPYPYFVFLSRARRRPITEYWPIGWDASLPRVPIPLTNGDPDVPLDLQMALNGVYDSFGYELFIDYGKPPVPPLTGDAESWADRLLREKGKR